jgi:hypothetical protein
MDRGKLPVPRPNGLQRDYVLSDDAAQLNVVPRIHGASAFRRRGALGGIAADPQGVAGGPAAKLRKGGRPLPGAPEQKLGCGPPRAVKPRTP